MRGWLIISSPAVSASRPAQSRANDAIHPPLVVQESEQQRAQAGQGIAHALGESGEGAGAGCGSGAFVDHEEGIGIGALAKPEHDDPKVSWSRAPGEVPRNRWRTIG
jgi:hypothetical protein